MTKKNIYYTLYHMYSYYALVLFIVSIINLSIINNVISFTIVLDPGHGGAFSGCKSDLLCEKDITLDLVQRIAEILKNHKNIPLKNISPKNISRNIKVIVTRNKDCHLNSNLQKDLALRKNCAQAHKADLFISLHINSKTDPKIRGFELYVPYAKEISIRSYLCAAVLHHHISQHAQANFVGNLGNVNGFDRGIRAAKFSVFKDICCPAVLIEWDYLSNKAVEKQLLDSRYRQKCAVIIAQGIISYISEHAYEK